MNTPFIVKGCPVADRGARCCHGCDGGWPGTQITTEAMTQAVQSGRIHPERLGCQPLVDRASAGLTQWQQLHAEQPADTQPMELLIVV